MGRARAQGEAPRSGTVRRRLARPVRALRERRTLRAQIFAGAAIVLIAATAVSLAMNARITQRRLAEEGQLLVEETLQVAAALVRDQRTQLRTALHSNVEDLVAQGVDAQTPPVELRRRAGVVQRAMGVRGAAFIDASGRVVGGSGVVPVDGAIDPAAPPTTTAKVVPAVDGSMVELQLLEVDDGLWLAALRDFGDARALQLRRLLVGDEVALLHDGVVRGRTSSALDGLSTDGPEAAGTTRIEVRGEPGRAGLIPIGEGAWVGVATTEPLQRLAGDLASGRIALVLGLTGVVLIAGNVLLRSVTRPLVDLAETARAVEAGAVDRPFRARSGDEIGQLAGTLESMRVTLGNQLRLITLQADAIRRATARIVTARDVERRRMAQDLHDGVQQQLVMLRLRVGLLDGLADEARTALARDVDEVIVRVRETSQAIFPSILADRGLSGALYSLATGAPVPVELDLRPDPLPRLPDAVEAGAYFIVSEAVVNATRHAAPSRLRIRVRTRPASVLVLISDDGRGFDVDAGELRVRPGRAGGSGLVNLRDRAVALGGVAHVRSEPGIGTVVAVRIPIGPDVARTSVGRSLQEEQHGGDAAVEVVGVAEAELSEDGVGVLLDGPFGDDELFGDR